MSNLNQAMAGFLVALLSIILVLGTLSISLLEGIVDIPSPSPAAIVSTFGRFITPLASQTPISFTPTATNAPLINILPSATPTATSTATQTQIPRVTQTHEQSNCGPILGWVRYIVKKGDTLYRIGKAFGVCVNQLQSANCLGSTTVIHTGQSLYVPNVQAQPTHASYKKAPRSTKAARPTRILPPEGVATIAVATSPVPHPPVVTEPVASPPSAP